MSKRLTTSDFIERATAVHNGKYGYSKAEYFKACVKVVITCPVHGDFEQTASDHLYGAGCKGCSDELRRNRLIEIRRKRSAAKPVVRISLTRQEAAVMRGCSGMPQFMYDKLREATA